MLIRSLVLFVMLLASSRMCAFGALEQIDWYSTDATDFISPDPDVYDRFNVAIPQSSTWVVQMIRVSDSAVIQTAADGGSIHPWMDSGNGNGIFTYTFNLDDAYVGTSVFTRFYDSANPTAGNYSYYADTAPFTLTWATDMSRPTSVPYNVGTIASTDWVAVPEPGSIALMLLGLATVAARRKITKA